MRTAATWSVGPVLRAGAGQPRGSRVDAARRRAASGISVLRQSQTYCGASRRRPRDQPQASAAFDATNGHRIGSAEARHESACTATSSLPVLAQKPHDFAGQSGLGHRYYVHPDGARLRLLGRDHRLVQSPSPKLAAIEHPRVKGRRNGSGSGRPNGSGDRPRRSGGDRVGRGAHCGSAKRIRAEAGGGHWAACC
jgi:hypothetical protein